MEPRLTRSAKRKQEASATTANASAGGAGPSTQAGHCLRNTRSRKAAAEASAKALKAPARTQPSQPALPPAVPAKRAAEKPLTRARSKRQATGKAAQVPQVKQEEDLPGAAALPEPAAQGEAGPSHQEAGPSSAAAPSSRMEADGKKGSDPKPAPASAAAAAAAAQKEADDQVHASQSL